MSATIRSKYGDHLSLETVTGTGDHTVSIRLTVGGSSRYIQRLFRPDEFLAAVATELNVLVIPRTDLPKVEVRGDEANFDYGEQGHTEPIPAGIHPDELIALGLHLKAHPPIDQAQVNALTELIRGIDGPATIGGKDLARGLLATGRVTITPDGGAS